MKLPLDKIDFKSIADEIALEREYVLHYCKVRNRLLNLVVNSGIENIDTLIAKYMLYLLMANFICIRRYEKQISDLSLNNILVILSDAPGIKTDAEILKTIKFSDKFFKIASQLLDFNYQQLDETILGTISLL